MVSIPLDGCPIPERRGLPAGQVPSGQQGYGFLLLQTSRRFAKCYAGPGSIWSSPVGVPNASAGASWAQPQAVTSAKPMRIQWEACLSFLGSLSAYLTRLQNVLLQVHRHPLLVHVVERIGHILVGVPRDLLVVEEHGT